MNNLAESIVGRKKSDKFDLYETPKWSTQLIAKRLLKDGVINLKESIYEPCSGAGSISKVLESFNFDITSSDIQDEDYIYGAKGIDAYKIESKCADIVFTNPPYNLMTKGNMLNEFLRIANKKVILLLNIFYLSSRDRKKILENSPLKYVYIHSDRLTMYPYGIQKPKNGGTKMFAWYVWEHGYKGEPVIRWISK